MFGNVIAIVFAGVFPGPIRSYPIVVYVLIAGVVAVLNNGILKCWAFPASFGARRLRSWLPACLRQTWRSPRHGAA